jgi:hypothetical protein
MPQDIFISYSSKDREKAEQHTELLASAGLSVWIDQSGIDVSSSWSKHLTTCANEMDIRYFIHGSVRTCGDPITLSSALFDIEGVGDPLSPTQI